MYCFVHKDPNNHIELLNAEPDGEQLVGRSVDVQDPSGKVRSAMVVGLEGDKVKLHYVGWANKLDEWLPSNSQRIRGDKLQIKKAATLAADSDDEVAPAAKPAAPAPAPATAAPDTVQDPRHPHPLQKLSSVYSGTYGCDGCGKNGTGTVYHCAQCNYDLHPGCLKVRAESPFCL